MYKLENWHVVEAKDGFTWGVKSNIYPNISAIQWEMIGWTIMGTL